MSHTHINERTGQFESDLPIRLTRKGCMPLDYIALSFRDPDALDALELFAKTTKDVQLGKDVASRVAAIRAKL